MTSAVEYSHAFGDVILNADTQPMTLSCTGRLYTRPADQAEAASEALHAAVVEPFLESEDTEESRRQFVEELQRLFEAWVDSMANKYVFSGKAKSHIYVFGSLRLDLHLSDADVDALCVVGGPALANVNLVQLREAFFLVFPVLLRTIMNVDEVVSITRAIVPVIKVRRGSHHADLAFAAVPALKNRRDIDSDALAETVDERSYQSLGGVRNGEAVSRSIPSPGVFWIAARAIKYWATRRRLYGSMYGYLGGGAVAIMVAKECQNNPMLYPAEVVVNFFETYYRVGNAILARHNELAGLGARGGGRGGAQQQPFWDFRNIQSIPLITVTAEVLQHADLLNPNDMMLVVNPVYPYSNTTRMMGLCEIAVLRDECFRALQILQGGKAAQQAPSEAARGFRHLRTPAVSLRDCVDLTRTGVWEDLTQEMPYLHSSFAYLEVSLGSAEAQVTDVWGKYLASRVRFLAAEIDEESRTAVTARTIPLEITPPLGWMLPGQTTFASASYISLHFNGAPLHLGDMETLVAQAGARFKKYIKDLGSVQGVIGPRLRCVSSSQLPDWAVEALAPGPSAEHHTTYVGVVQPAVQDAPVAPPVPRGAVSAAAAAAPVCMPRATPTPPPAAAVPSAPAGVAEGVAGVRKEVKNEPLAPLAPVKLEGGGVAEMPPQQDTLVLTEDDFCTEDDMSDDLILVEAGEAGAGSAQPTESPSAAGKVKRAREGEGGDVEDAPRQKAQRVEEKAAVDDDEGSLAPSSETGSDGDTAGGAGGDPVGGSRAGRGVAVEQSAVSPTDSHRKKPGESNSKKGHHKEAGVSKEGQRPSADDPSGGPGTGRGQGVSKRGNRTGRGRGKGRGRGRKVK